VERATEKLLCHSLLGGLRSRESGRVQSLVTLQFEDWQRPSNIVATSRAAPSRFQNPDLSSRLFLPLPIILFQRNSTRPDGLIRDAKARRN
jgi:hypothetical protein